MITVYGVSAGAGVISGTSTAVGIASSTPWALLSVSGIANAQKPLVDVASSSNLSYFRVNYDGVVTAGQLAFPNATGTSIYTSGSSTIQTSSAHWLASGLRVHGAHFQ